MRWTFDLEKKNNKEKIAHNFYIADFQTSEPFHQVSPHIFIPKTKNIHDRASTQMTVDQFLQGPSPSSISSASRKHDSSFPREGRKRNYTRRDQREETNPDKKISGSVTFISGGGFPPRRDPRKRRGGGSRRRIISDRK